jgi:hypothetical protein
MKMVVGINEGVGGNENGNENENVKSVVATAKRCGGGGASRIN